MDEAIVSRRPTLNASLNAAKLVRVQSDSELRESIELCDFVTADGVPSSGPPARSVTTYPGG